MNAIDISTLVRFNAWANGRLLAACEQLPADAFVQDAEPDPGWGSLRGILVHALDTEYGWRCVLQGLDADTILHPTDFADVAALKARWAIEDAAWRDYVDHLERQKVDLGAGADEAGVGAIWHTILHVMIHSVQHRSEAAAILTGHGFSPGDLDFDVFLKEGSGTA